MIDDPVLLNDWHVVVESSRVAAGVVPSARLLGQDLVLWRSQVTPCAFGRISVFIVAQKLSGRVLRIVVWFVPTAVGTTTFFRQMRSDLRASGSSSPPLRA